MDRVHEEVLEHVQKDQVQCINTLAVDRHLAAWRGEQQLVTVHFRRCVLESGAIGGGEGGGTATQTRTRMSLETTYGARFSKDQLTLYASVVSVAAADAAAAAAGKMCRFSPIPVRALFMSAWVG